MTNDYEDPDVVEDVFSDYPPEYLSMRLAQAGLKEFFSSFKEIRKTEKELRERRDDLEDRLLSSQSELSLVSRGLENASREYESASKSFDAGEISEKAFSLTRKKFGGMAEACETLKSGIKRLKNEICDVEDDEWKNERRLEKLCSDKNPAFVKFVDVISAIEAGFDAFVMEVWGVGPT